MVEGVMRLRTDVRKRSTVKRYSATPSSSQCTSAQSNRRQSSGTGSTAPKKTRSSKNPTNSQPSTSSATSNNPKTVTKRTRSKSCNGRDRSRPQSRNPSRGSSPEPKRGRGRPRKCHSIMGSDDEDGAPVSHRTRSAANSRNVSPDPLFRSSIRAPKKVGGPSVSGRTRSSSAASRTRSRNSGRRMNSGPSSRRCSPSSIRRQIPSRSEDEWEGASVSQRTRSKSQSRQTSAASSRNASPERSSRSTIRTPRNVNGASVSGRNRSSSAASRAGSRSSSRGMDSGSSSRRSSPSPVRRQGPSTSRSASSLRERIFKKSMEEIFGKLSPDEMKSIKEDSKNSSEIDEYLKERLEKDVEIDWGFPPNMEKRFEHLSSIEAIQKEEKFLLNAGVDVEKVEKWKANKTYELESAKELRKKSEQRFGNLKNENTLFSDLRTSGKDAVKKLIMRERAPMKLEIELLVKRQQYSFLVIKDFIDSQRDKESALRVELFNKNVSKEKKKEMFVESQCSTFSDFQMKFPSVFIQPLKWAWKTVIIPTRKFKEAHAHVLTLEKEFQRKLGLGQQWEDADFKRMEQITQIKEETLKNWLEQRREQDKKDVIDPLYAKTSLYSKEEIDSGEFSEIEKRRWEVNHKDKKMYEDLYQERRERQRHEWEMEYPFYKYLGERSKFLEELVDRPRQSLDIEVELFVITVDFFRITKMEIENFLCNERKQETSFREEHYIKFQPNLGTIDMDDIWSKNPNWKEFFELTSGMGWNSNVVSFSFFSFFWKVQTFQLRIAWLEHTGALSADVPSTSQPPPNRMAHTSPSHSERAKSAEASEPSSIDMDDDLDHDYEDQDFEMDVPSSTADFDAPESFGNSNRHASEDIEARSVAPSDMMSVREQVAPCVAIELQDEEPHRQSPINGLEEDEAEIVGAHEDADVEHPEQEEQEVPQEPEDDEDHEDDDEALAEEQPPLQNGIPQISPTHSERAQSAEVSEPSTIGMDDQLDIDYDNDGQDVEMNEPSNPASPSHISPPAEFDVPDYAGSTNRHEENDEAPADVQPPHQDAPQEPLERELDEETMRLVISNSDNPIQPEPIIPFSRTYSGSYLRWKEEEVTDWMKKVLVKGGYKAFMGYNGHHLHDAIYDRETRERTGFGEAFWKMIKCHLDKVYSYDPFIPRI
ncbi:hypothetical protein CRE_12339 [Caenorhabditis remanei]|uniref:Uncharacterized protein n=1 Tax=Caenorhabditis remanei TaxID=31234 RepID=E3NJJ5_CAERE|nr:hypothetical protein CRE_12339 [Caenorhabditis remanei]